MDDRESGSDALHSCPYLGLASDPSLHCSFLTSSHRCFRWPTPQPVDYQQQRSHCLSADFHGCSWFASALEDRPDRRRRSYSRAGYAGLLGVVVAAALVVATLAYFRPWSLLLPVASDAGRAALGAEPPATGPSPAATSTMVPEPTPEPAALAASLTPLPSPTAERQRTAAGSAATAPPATAPAPRAPATPAAHLPTSTPARPMATPWATPSGVPGSAAVRVYTVKEGDNLYSLARTFGVTVQELMKANNLQDGAYLRVGQTLVVPAAGR